MSHPSVQLAIGAASGSTRGPTHGLQRVDLDAISHAKAFLHGALDIPFHWHREMEILLVLQGSARIVVEGRLCLMQANDLMIINPHEAHNSMSLSADTIVCGVHLDVGHFERLGLEGFAARNYLCRTFLHGKSFDRISRSIKAFVARIILTDTGRSSEVAMHGAMATALACCIHRRVPWVQIERDEDVRRSGRDRILRLMDSLARSHHALSLNQLAASEDVSVSHLSRLFRFHTGMSFRDYAQILKLEAVMEDLMTTDATVSSIMAARGVGNPALFFNRFRARFGASPGKVRGSKFSRQEPSPPSALESPAALVQLQKYLSHLGDASDLTFGLPVSGTSHVTVSAFHRFPR